MLILWVDGEPKHYIGTPPLILLFAVCPLVGLDPFLKIIYTAKAIRVPRMGEIEGKHKKRVVPDGCKGCYFKEENCSKGCSHKCTNKTAHVVLNDTTGRWECYSYQTGYVPRLRAELAI